MLVRLVLKLENVQYSLGWVNVKNTAASTFTGKNHRKHYKTPYFML